MGEEGETQRVQIQALKTANSEPELSARARASRRPHSPTRHRGTAGACVGWGRGGGGLGLPGSGNHAGEVREAADGHSGTWTPGEQSCPRPAPSAPPARSDSPAVFPALSGRRCGRAVGGARARWVCPGARSCLRTGSGSPRRPAPHCPSWWVSPSCGRGHSPLCPPT